MAENNTIGFKGLGSYGNNKKSIVKAKDELNSGTSTSYSKVMSSGKSSSDPFHGLNEPLARRVQAFNDRRQMRKDAKTEMLVGGKGMIKSSLTPVVGQDTKLYNKNQKLEDKLNERLGYKKSIDKKNLKPVSTGGSTVTNSNINNTPTPTINSISGATSIKPQATINKPVVKATVIDAYKKNSLASSGSSYKNSNYINAYDRNENVKNFQAKHGGAKNINEFENKNSLEDKDKTNAKF